MALFDIPGRLWTLARKVEDMFTLQSKMHASLEAVEVRLRSLEERMIRFDAEQSQIITAAQAAANASISDIVTRLTKVEIHQSHLQARLPSP